MTWYKIEGPFGVTFMIEAASEEKARRRLTAYADHHHQGKYDRSPNEWHITEDIDCTILKARPARRKAGAR